MTRLTWVTPELVSLDSGSEEKFIEWFEGHFIFEEPDQPEGES